MEVMKKVDQIQVRKPLVEKKGNEVNFPDNKMQSKLKVDKRQNEKKKSAKKVEKKNSETYTVMKSTGTDFYIANPDTGDRQIDFELNQHQWKNGDVVNDCDNPAYRSDSPEDNRSTNNVHKKNSSTPDLFLNNSYKYGWLEFTPKFIQFLNNPISFLVFLCLTGIAQGLVITGVAFTILTSIEKQFGMNSAQVALFGTAYDLAYGIFCVLVGYVGYKHKPRWLSIGLIVMIIGALLATLPKFIIGDYTAGVKRTSDFCVRTNNGTVTPECGGSAEWYYTMIFILANVLMGIGATPIYVLGPAHLDEITTRGQNSMYTGIFFASAALGPAIGFVIGLPILSTWVDIKQPPNSNLTPNHRNWVGAWWIGYLVGAVALLIPVLPMLGFPPVFPNAESLKEKKKELEDTIQENKKLNHDFKSIWPSTKSLVKNKPFIFICLASASESLAIGGFSTFIPKFVETQFHFPAGTSALYTGLIVIPGAAGGMLFGGYLIKRMEWNCKQTLRAATIMAFIACALVAATLIGCGGRNVVGGGVGYYNSSSTTELMNTCNKDCQCSTRYYKPVCSSHDQRTYFSPCHAGCSKKNAVGDKYFNCTCIPPGKGGHVKEGRCTPECSLFPAFVVCTLLLMFFTFMNNVPMINATFRVVPEGQGSFAMGFQQVFVRFLGFIPAPTLFGRLIDESCKLWHRDECTGKRSSCLEYNNGSFRYYIFLLGIVTKFLSFLFIFAAYKTYQLPVVKKETDNSNGNIFNMKEIAENGDIKV